MNVKYQINGEIVDVFDEKGMKTTRDNTQDIQRLLKIENNLEILEEYLVKAKKDYNIERTRYYFAKDDVKSFILKTIVMIPLIAFLSFSVSLLFLLFIIPIVKLSIDEYYEFADEKHYYEELKLKADILSKKYEVLNDKYEKLLKIQQKASQTEQKNGFISENILLKDRLKLIKKMIELYMDCDLQKESLTSIRKINEYQELSEEEQHIIDDIVIFNKTLVKKRKNMSN